MEFNMLQKVSSLTPHWPPAKPLAVQTKAEAANTCPFQMSTHPTLATRTTTGSMSALAPTALYWKSLRYCPMPSMYRTQFSWPLQYTAVQAKAALWV